MAQFDPAAILRVLTEHGVVFVVVGHTAAILHGSPTVTDDVDVTPARDIDNAERLYEALTSMHAVHRVPNAAPVDPLPVDERDFLRWQAQSYTTDFGPLDVVPFTVGVGGYEAVAAQAQTFDVGGVRISVASLDDVIASKEALGRPKDRSQLPALYATRAALLARQNEGSDANEGPSQAEM